MYCSECGNELNDKAVVCPNCGVPTKNQEEIITPKIGKGVAALASILIVGLGQMLQGRVGRGVAWLIGGLIIGLVTGGLAAPIIWIASAIDAYMWDAYKIN